MPRPVARIYHTMLDVPESGRVLLFGGVTQHGWGMDLQDTWAYFPKTEQWQELGNLEAGAVFDAAYDAESKRAAMLNLKGETWSYHIENNQWQVMDPEQSPSGRCGHKMVYDSQSERVILFGGFKCTSVSDPHFSDTWSYDYNTDNWQEMTPLVNPPPRIYHGMSYDSQSDRVIVWGGRVEDRRVWSYSFEKNSWTVEQAAKGPQDIRAYHSMSYDPKTDRIIIFGGLELEAPMAFGGRLLGETWPYDIDANEWELLAPLMYPEKQSHHAMIFNKATDKIYFTVENLSHLIPILSVVRYGSLIHKQVNGYKLTGLAVSCQSFVL